MRVFLSSKPGGSFLFWLNDIFSFHFFFPFQLVLWMRSSFWKLESKNDFPIDGPPHPVPFRRKEPASLLNSQSDAHSSSPARAHLLIFCFLLPLMMSPPMATLWYWYCCRKEKPSKTKCRIPGEIGRVKEWGALAFCFLSFWGRKQENGNMAPSSIVFVCLFHYAHSSP